MALATAKILPMKALSDSQPEIEPSYFATERKRIADWQAKSGGINDPYTCVDSLTPQLARYLLSVNDGNRKKKPKFVSQLVRQMEHDNFMLNGEPIIMAETGLMNDGQHRCEAVLQAGKAQRTVFVIGVSRKARMTIDEGVKRSAADLLSIEGFNSPVQTAAGLRHLWNYRDHGSIKSTKMRGPSNMEILEMANAIGDLRSLTNAAVQSGSKYSRQSGLPSVLSFCALVLAEKGGTRAACDFIRDWHNEDGKSAYARNGRKRMGRWREELTANQQAYLIIDTWNGHRKGLRPEDNPLLVDTLPEAVG